MVPRGGGLIVGEGPIKMQEANKVIRDQGWSDEQVHVATLGSDECLASGTAQSSNVALLNNAAHQSSVVCEVLKPGGEVVVLAGNDSNEIAQRLQESGFENIRCDKCGTVRAIKPQYKEDVNVSPPATALNAHQLESGLRIVWNYCANKVEEILRQNENNLDSLNIDQLDIQRAEEALNGYNEKRKTGKDLVLNILLQIRGLSKCLEAFKAPVLFLAAWNHGHRVGSKGRKNPEMRADNINPEFLKTFAKKASVVFIPEAGTGQEARETVVSKYNQALRESEGSPKFQSLVMWHDLTRQQQKLVLIKENIANKTSLVFIDDHEYNSENKKGPKRSQPGQWNGWKVVHEYIDEKIVMEALNSSQHTRYWGDRNYLSPKRLKNTIERMCKERCSLLRVELEGYRPVFFAGVHGKNKPKNNPDQKPYLELLLKILALRASEHQEAFVAAGDENAVPSEVLPQYDEILEVLPNDTHIDWMCSAKGLKPWEAFHTGLSGDYGLKIADSNNPQVSDGHNGIYAGFRVPSA